MIKKGDVCAGVVFGREGAGSGAICLFLFKRRVGLQYLIYLFSTINILSLQDILFNNQYV
jgi:hypothetical protein